MELICKIYKIISIAWNVSNGLDGIALLMLIFIPPLVMRVIPHIRSDKTAEVFACIGAISYGILVAINILYIRIIVSIIISRFTE